MGKIETRFYILADRAFIWIIETKDGKKHKFKSRKKALEFLHKVDKRGGVKVSHSKKWYDPELCKLAKDHLLTFVMSARKSGKSSRGVELAYTVCTYKESWRQVKASRKSFKRRGCQKL